MLASSTSCTITCCPFSLFDDDSRLSPSDPGYMSRKIESFERINSIREANGNFDPYNSCKRQGTRRLHECKRLVSCRLQELHGSKFPFVSRIKFFRSKLSNFSAHVSEVSKSPKVVQQCSPRAHQLAAQTSPGPCTPSPAQAWPVQIHNQLAQAQPRPLIN